MNVLSKGNPAAGPGVIEAESRIRQRKAARIGRT
jgi:hypothetical protein